MEKSLHLPEQGRKLTHDTAQVQWVQWTQAISQNAEERLITGNQRSSRECLNLIFPFAQEKKESPY